MFRVANFPERRNKWTDHWYTAMYLLFPILILVLIDNILSVMSLGAEIMQSVQKLARY